MQYKSNMTEKNMALKIIQDIMTSHVTIYILVYSGYGSRNFVLWLMDCILVLYSSDGNPDSKVHGANMGPTWVLLAPDGPHVGPMNLAIGEYFVM